MSMLNVFQIAGSALNAQSLRLNATASNLANADSVTSEDGQPYRAKQVVFAARPVAGPAAVGVQVTQVVESAAPLRLVFEPNNPAANPDGYVEMPNVNVVEEMVNMISASRSYQNNAEVMSTARTLLQRTLQIGQ
ncbi:MAG TPA: flagellar basal body rod protein FlgC [Thauera sp.]|jgi:flagellar basal-body rod protein FlgC|uniref:flagellar basal body rod protein FlgC n=1 Tax=Thauera sp. TaxID=1905334 RepID=UPI001A38F6DD|nr:flagellar basal body rod protein FlgC [Thauera sp.]HNV91572.1 flagellar basal body rod protein FlgC [Thauera aminoaromatica]MBL8462773.1 flagellar basal body rod protein FlgC [Thauera sp.]MCP5224872.1 flagellar basal body rod protein FlgC [Thauera sp.]HPE04937.1 flagellar basal body rod protein FlgC [Thauera sp.]HRV77940.1 flagellar basal body rod protein FlgC [Thauera sp.]